MDFVLMVNVYVLMVLIQEIIVNQELIKIRIKLYLLNILLKAIDFIINIENIL